MSKNTAKRSRGGHKSRGMTRVSHELPARPANEIEDNPKARRKLTIAVPAELIEWVTSEAKRLDVSVSSLFVESMMRDRRAAALQAYLDEVGMDDVTQEDRDALFAELREAGVKL